MLWVREDLSEKVHLGMSHQALEAQEMILHGTVLGAALHPSLQYHYTTWRRGIGELPWGVQGRDNRAYVQGKRERESLSDAGSVQNFFSMEMESWML